MKLSEQWYLTLAVTLIGAIIIGAIFVVDMMQDNSKITQESTAPYTETNLIKLWRQSEMYTVINEYLAEDHEYIRGVYDCTEMSEEITRRLRDIDYDARKIVVVRRTNLDNFTKVHAITEVVIWIDNNGRLIIPNDKWVYLEELNQEAK